MQTLKKLLSALLPKKQLSRTELRRQMRTEGKFKKRNRDRNAS